MKHNYYILDGKKIIEPVCMLVSFSKVYDDGLIDVQYHVFTGLKRGIISIIHTDLLQEFLGKGYTWSAIPFDENHAYQLGFTVSEAGV